VKGEQKYKTLTVDPFTAYRFLLYYMRLVFTFTDKWYVQWVKQPRGLSRIAHMLPQILLYGFLPYRLFSQNKLHP